MSIHGKIEDILKRFVRVRKQQTKRQHQSLPGHRANCLFSVFLIRCILETME